MIKKILSLSCVCLFVLQVLASQVLASAHDDARPIFRLVQPLNPPVLLADQENGWGMPIDERPRAAALEVTLRAFVPESNWRKAVRVCGSFVLAGAIANATPPVFLESLESSGISTATFLWPAIVYTGASFAIETFFRTKERHRDTFTNSMLKLAAVANAALQVTYLFQVENSHRQAVGDHHWDGYDTFFAVLAPFVVLNEYLASNNLAKFFLRSKRQRCIESAINKMNDRTLTHFVDFFENERFERGTVFDIDIPVGLKCIDFFSLASSLITAPISVLCFANSFNDFNSIMSGKKVDLSVPSVLFSLAPAFFYSYFQFHVIREFECADLYALPQGVFKSIPLMALSWRSSQIIPAPLNYMLLAPFWGVSCCYESKEFKDMVLNIATQVPKLKKTSAAKRKKLKEILI